MLLVLVLGPPPAEYAELFLWAHLLLGLWIRSKAFQSRNDNPSATRISQLLLNVMPAALR